MFKLHYSGVSVPSNKSSCSSQVRNNTDMVPIGLECEVILIYYLKHDGDMKGADMGKLEGASSPRREDENRDY